MNWLKQSFRGLFNIGERKIGLDLIRCLAIYYVFLEHGRILVPESLQSKYAFLTILPFDGVSVFFLLSGFLISTILNKHLVAGQFSGKELQNFWTRRILRIVPNYVVVLLVLLYAGAEAASFNWSYLLFSHNLFEDQGNFFKVAWSLSIEMWFYFLFPLCLFFFVKWMSSKQRAMYLTVATFILFPFLLRLLNFLLPELFDVESVRKVVLFRLDSMMYGVLASTIYIYYRTAWDKYAKAFAWLGVVCLVVIILVRAQSTAISTNSTFNTAHFSIVHFYQEVTIYYIEALPILFFFPICTRLRSLKFSFLNKAVVFVSKISYSLYLVHASVVLWFLIPKMQEYHFIAGSDKGSFLLYLYYVGLSLVFSVVLYLLVESPFMNWRLRSTTKVKV